MPATCVVGLQWGDEAKGKIVDLLTGEYDIVVRYQGGANAGHTVVLGGEPFKLSLVPSGIFRPQVQCVIANGVVLHPGSLLEEIERLRARGVQVEDNLLVSNRAHVIFPWHIEEDRLLEKVAGGEAIGTTLRGIGPCYRDKVGRTLAFRVGDLYRQNFRDRVRQVAQFKQRMLQCLSGEPIELDADAIYEQYRQYAEQLRRWVGDSTSYLLDALEANKRILFEGAQGALLDVDHGTFPYVTSSNSSGVGVSSGSGVPARYLTKVIGIIKAYSTRVGGGPFPTEQANEIGQYIRDRGNEYGTVTRRPRRCGWFDAVAVRYTARLSGVDVLAVMLLDVLSGLEELKICVAYELDGQKTTVFPAHVDELWRVQPVYETLPGWKEEISHVRRWEDLPPNAQAYLRRISELIGRPLEIISVGPHRDQTIFLRGQLS
ncbi:MAG: adenylosuccinate synthase [Thermoguttaceae bacterium]|nr:adenylosuccinate synthase [Thermoguttaceae bacterium]MDW8037640.1 adenylosuccinate synthase [Thermoguttaceae bacterium]